MAALADEGLDAVMVYVSEKSEERVTVLPMETQQGWGAALRVRAVKSSEFGEGEL